MKEEKEIVIDIQIEVEKGSIIAKGLIKGLTQEKAQNLCDFVTTCTPFQMALNINANNGTTIILSDVLGKKMSLSQFGERVNFMNASIKQIENIMTAQHILNALNKDHNGTKKAAQAREEQDTGI